MRPIMNTLISPVQRQYLAEDTAIVNLSSTDQCCEQVTEQISSSAQLNEENNGDAITSSYVRGYN